MQTPKVCAGTAENLKALFDMFFPMQNSKSKIKINISSFLWNKEEKSVSNTLLSLGLGIDHWLLTILKWTAVGHP